MRILDTLIHDHGSRHAGSGGPCHSQNEAVEFVRKLKRNKESVKATPTTWGLITNAGPARDDNGESGAGLMILRKLHRVGVRDHIVAAPRWYGGKPLGGDRFRHVQTAVHLYLAALATDT